MAGDNDDFAALFEKPTFDAEAEQLMWTQVKHMVTPLKTREKVRSDVSPKISMRSIMDDYSYDPEQHYSTNQAPAPVQEDVERKITKGRIAIDMKIDLHDMQREDAHRHLYVSLHKATQKGLRTMLVITGKGRAGEGVLKQALPLWLASASFADIVSSYAPSAIQHGGSGAFYVRLRRP